MSVYVCGYGCGSGCGYQCVYARANVSVEMDGFVQARDLYLVQFPSQEGAILELSLHNLAFPQL